MMEYPRELEKMNHYVAEAIKEKFRRDLKARLTEISEDVIQQVLKDIEGDMELTTNTAYMMGEWGRQFAVSVKVSDKRDKQTN